MDFSSSRGVGDFYCFQEVLIPKSSFFLRKTLPIAYHMIQVLAKKQQHDIISSFVCFWGNPCIHGKIYWGNQPINVHLCAPWSRQVMIAVWARTSTARALSGCIFRRTGWQFEKVTLSGLMIQLIIHFVAKEC